MLVIYWVAAAQYFKLSNLMATPIFPNGFSGILKAVPFAIWLYLAVEGGALVSDEMVNSQRDIKRGFLTGIANLTVMAFLTLFLTAGVTNFHLVENVDFPLPQALSAVYQKNSVLCLLVSIIGLFGLIASLHGIIIGYSRQTYAMARLGFLPKFLARVDAKRQVPVWALLIYVLLVYGVCILYFVFSKTQIFSKNTTQKDF